MPVEREVPVMGTPCRFVLAYRRVVAGPLLDKASLTVSAGWDLGLCESVVGRSRKFERDCP